MLNALSVRQCNWESQGGCSHSALKEEPAPPGKVTMIPSVHTVTNSVAWGDSRSVFADIEQKT